MTYVVALVLSVGSIAVGGVLAARGRRMDIAEWSVGGRRFGSVLFWFLMVGETFTTFALLGASQGVYVDGAPGYYVLGTVVLTAALGYWIAPRIWRAGRDQNLMTEGDYFARRFAAPWLGLVLALFGIAALLLYARVQLTGLALILQTLLGSALSGTWYVVCAGALVIAFIFTGGMRSAAFGAVVKDIALVVVLLVIALTAAGAAGVHGWYGIFDAVAAKHPAAATLPGITGAADRGLWWWMSFLLLSPLGAFVLPHAFQVYFTAKDARTIRRNQVVQPLYSLFYVFIIVIALAALLAGPGLAGPDANGSLLEFVRTHSPDWLVGLMAGAGILVALVPTAVLMLTCGSLFSRNVYRVIRTDASDASQMRAGRVAVVVVTALAVGFTLLQAETLVNVMVAVYDTVTQLAPALVLSMVWRRTTAAGVLAGLLTGIVCLVVPPVTDGLAALVPAGTVPGLPALVVNTVVAVVVSRVTRAPAADAIAVGMPDAAPAARQDVGHGR